jgi:hypothetical protein
MAPKLLFAEEAGLKHRELSFELRRLLSVELSDRQQILCSLERFGGIEKEARVAVSAADIGLVKQ